MATVAANRRSGSASGSRSRRRRQAPHDPRSARSSAAKGTKAETKATKAESPGTKAETKATKAESPGTKAETKATRAEPKGTKAQTKATKAESPGTKAQTKPGGSPAKASKPAAARKAGPKAKARKPKSARGAGVGTSLATSSAGSKAAKTLVKAAAHGPSSITGKAALAVAKLVARRVLSSGTGAMSEAPRDGVRRAALAVGSLRERALQAASTTVDVEASQRPPVQAAVDVAVPCRVAWHEWARLEWLPEGVDAVVDIRRKGDRLSGRLRGNSGDRWAAHILDEREENSFAWESKRGSDCAGLITFHALADRLTRIELSLDIRPVSVAQAAALSTRRADRRAAADLRRFKARLELISPDSYPDPDDHDD